MFGDPGPCPVCGTAHAACKSPSDGDTTLVGISRGVIVIRQLPQRDRTAPAGVPAPQASPAVTPTVKPKGMSPERAARVAKRKQGAVAQEK